MLGSFMHCLQKRDQALCECDIALAAPQASSFFEVSLAKTAHRTFLAGSAFLDLFRCSDAKQEIRKRKTLGILDALFLGTGLAQIYLLHFAILNLCQEDCRIITFANIAQHLCNQTANLPKDSTRIVSR